MDDFIEKNDPVSEKGTLGSPKSGDIDAIIEKIVTEDIGNAKIGLVSGAAPLTLSSPSPADAIPRVLRFRWLGLSHLNAAKAAGVPLDLFRRWLEEFPALREAMDTVFSLSVADVAAKLRGFMDRTDASGLSAVRFFLEARAEEFQAKARVEVTTPGDARGVVEAIRRDIYGIHDDDRGIESGGAGNPDGAGNLPALEVSEAGIPRPSPDDRVGEESAGGWLDDLHP
ncbi:MAG: hypothetical protein KIPDCIKN_04356 [Haliscomenobacter sp.]|nr:hypothetical protein [Haliscomenobacter sp.]